MHFNVYSGVMGETPERIIYAAGLATCGDPDLWQDMPRMDGIERLDGRMPDAPESHDKAPSLRAGR